ncbi:hypothetical protein BDN67DRAFT_725072 [Paxillus ammoniavirescens]|nr:hypothetical protein BDN67DRAFT_725072 [Paxillus ammoniavirescens]
MVSTQPFPSRPPPPAPQPARVPVSGHLSTPAPPRSTRLPPPLDRATSKDSEVLKTPSSIAPSPMLNPAPTSSVPPPITVPIRTRQVSTDSKDSKKKAANFFGLFRTKSGSSKPLDPPVTSTTTRASTDNQRVHTDAPSTSAPAATPAPQRVASSSAVKEPKERTPALQPAASAHAGAQPKPKGKVLDPIIIPPPQKATRERDTAPHNFTPFKFLTMHSKRNRTMSAASLDVCDGNTAVSRIFLLLRRCLVNFALDCIRPIPSLDHLIIRLSRLSHYLLLYHRLCVTLWSPRLNGGTGRKLRGENARRIVFVGPESLLMSRRNRLHQPQGPRANARSWSAARLDVLPLLDPHAVKAEEPRCSTDLQSVFSVRMFFNILTTSHMLCILCHL